MPSQRITPIPLQPRGGSNGSPSLPHSGSEARCVPCKVLKSAIRGVLNRWARRPRSMSPNEAGEQLDLLVAAIHQAWSDIAPVVDPRVHSALGRRLLEQLRAEIVEGWPGLGLPESEVLPLFAAIERVRVAIEPNWAQTFAQHLSGSDGLALLMDVAHDLRSPLTSTEEGYVEIVAREIAPTRIEFAVRDSGKGMSPEKINTLFQPLRKESGRRGQLFSQTGLGLTICRKLAIAMKSELKVESRIGWGTSFFFEVELMPVPPRRSGPRATPRTSGATRASGPRPRP